MQRQFRLVFIWVVLTALALAIGPAGAQEVQEYRTSTPCAPGAAYDPACDVDHDGDVDIFNIQLTAGRWGQTGVWMSDNDHNHLGQNWAGSNNALKLTGAYGNPDYAPLVLSNSLGMGLRIASASDSGVYSVSHWSRPRTAWSGCWSTRSRTACILEENMQRCSAVGCELLASHLFAASRFVDLLQTLALWPRDNPRE